MSQREADYAAAETNSRGREFPEKPHPYRSAFERDRDRIIHCSAFRRLEGKTQVFTPGLDDYYRTRLTHTIEVSQIGRTIAKALGLNQALTEAICLAHDLGHAPFGHAGETALNDLTAKVGGFEHNRQSLRIVELLEHPYPDFLGLNLTYETRLGLAKHRSTYDHPAEDAFEQTNCSLEGQVADIADRIAYNCHDLEDGLRAGLIESDGAGTIKLVAEAQQRINASSIDDSTIRRTRTAKAIIDRLVSDCIEATQNALAKANIKTLDDVYNHNGSLIVLPAQCGADLVELEKFLLKNFYFHPTVRETAEKVEDWLGGLFRRLLSKPELMPGYFRGFIPDHGIERTVCDYVAGMTDRFCLKMLNEESHTD
ncbi:MAG: deoxyguanosinetriphosphate triphosphohydrolase [Sedimentisphaerales bacterium]|nr:deoxyguanosinetriphosphate triphosphohydrolase [Sedimentisphaerales bacterium]